MYSFEYNYAKVVIKWKTYNADDETLREFERKAKSFTTKELSVKITTDILENTGVHPESYEIANRLQKLVNENINLEALALKHL